MKLLAIACSLALFSSSCATIFTRANKKFVVRSNEPQTEIFLNNHYLGKGSATAKMRPYETDVLVGKKQGCSTTTKQLNKRTYWDWFLFGNCLLNHCIGMLIDVVTGAHRGLDQEHYIVTPKCNLL